MKCTNKYKILLPVLILALLLLTGCTQRSDVAEAYQLYETSDNYALTESSASAAPELLAENLCVGGTENSATDGIDAAFAQSAGVFSVEDEVVTYAQNIYQRMYPASTTKILTAYIALKYGNLDDVITVEDDELIVSFLDMVENHKMIVENSGLLTVAALKHLNVKGKKVVSVLSGGNMDVITMASVVQLGLIQRDRIFTISVLLPDRPGELTKVSQKIAEQQGNIIKLDHNQFYSTNRNAAVELKITMEAFGTEHKQQIMQELEKDGYRPKLIRTNL